MKDEREQFESAKEQRPKFAIKFNIQIYEINRKNQNHMVDLSLEEGHPLAFFPLTSSFYQVLENFLYI